MEEGRMPNKMVKEEMIMQNSTILERIKEKMSPFEREAAILIREHNENTDRIKQRVWKEIFGELKGEQYRVIEEQRIRMESIVNKAAGSTSPSPQTSTNPNSKNEDEDDGYDIWNVTYHCDLKMRITRVASKPTTTYTESSQASDVDTPITVTSLVRPSTEYSASTVPIRKTQPTLALHRQHCLSKSRNEPIIARKPKLVDIHIA